MAITDTDILEFTQFLHQRANQGEADLTIAQIAAQWEADRELNETLDDIRQSEIDIQAGRGKPVAETFADIRQKLGWTK